MNLFLQGPVGIGKSTLLREALAPYAGAVGGLSVQRLLRDGAAVGFRALVVSGALVPVELEYAHADGTGGVFYLDGKAKLPVLEAALLGAYEAAAGQAVGIVLLDEIGGMELASEAVMAPLRALLTGPRPCVGVFKAAGNLARATVGLSGQVYPYPALHRELEVLIRGTGELIDVTTQNRAAVRHRVDGYLRELALA